MKRTFDEVNIQWKPSIGGEMVGGMDGDARKHAKGHQQLARRLDAGGIVAFSRLDAEDTADKFLANGGETVNVDRSDLDLRACADIEGKIDAQSRVIGDGRWLVDLGQRV